MRKQVMMNIIFSMGLFVAMQAYAQQETAPEVVKPLVEGKQPRLIPLPLTDIISPYMIDYQIQYGDTLGKIARKFGTTIESIKKINHLATHQIRAGQKLHVWNVPMIITIDKSDNILIVKAGEMVIKQYQVATGAANITPVGSFSIASRLEHPTWFKKGEIIPPGDPANALGTRWLGFDMPQYGIHGTTHPELIGQQVSHGCVRMRNEDVEELFAYIAIGTKVNIQD